MKWVKLATEKPKRNTDEKYAVLFEDDVWPLPLHERIGFAYWLGDGFYADGECFPEDSVTHWLKLEYPNI